MKLTTKFIFGAALSVVGIATISPQVLAAEVTNLNSTGTIKLTADGKANPRLTVDAIINNFGIDFSIDQAVMDGDHIEFSTHALPLMPNQDVFSDATKKLKIGELKLVKTVNGTRAYQNIGNPISSEDFSKLKAEEQTQYTYRINFNKNAEGLQNINFGLSRQNGTAYYSIVDKDYPSRAWIKVGNNEILTADFTVARWTKYIRDSSSWFSRSSLDSATGKIQLTMGYKVKENHEGGKVEFEFKNPYFKFVEQTGTGLRRTTDSNFIYSDSSEVNQFGVIRPDNIGKMSYELNSQTNNKLVYDITDHNSNDFLSGFNGMNLELTDEGKKYFAENNKLPEIQIGAKFIRKDGSTLAEFPNLSGNVNIVGNASNFFSEIKEDVKKDEEPKTPEEPQVPQVVEEPQQPEEIKVEEIQAPNTGFSGGISALALSAFSLLGVATFFARKK